MNIYDGSADAAAYAAAGASWKCHVYDVSEFRISQSMHIYLNNSVKFHPDQIWNDEVGFSEEDRSLHQEQHQQDEYWV